MAGCGGSASGLLAGAAAAACFFGRALVVAVFLALGLRTGDLATFVLLARAFVRGARLAATVFADFFVVFFPAAIFVVFGFFFFGMLVFLIAVAHFSESHGANGFSVQWICSFVY
jgi:hypothetical protein